MATLQVRENTPHSRVEPLMLLCFFAVYVIWGSTYLAIRFTVADVPPVLAAGIRFLIAGGVLLFWSIVRGAALPNMLQWRNIAVLSALMFLVAYSGVFWAETRMASGITAVLVAMVPIWTSLLEVFAFREYRWRWSIGGVLLMGLAGVVLLSTQSGASGVNWLACGAVLLSNMSWAAGSVISKRMDLPQSKPLLAGGEMLLGGVMLVLFSAILGELSSFPHFTLRSSLALLYLIGFGSLVAFTAFVYLLSRLRATAVASYAYVNPLVALVLGHFLGKEAFGASALAGTALILSSVILILRTKRSS